MMKIEEIKDVLHETVRKVFLIVFPPIGEESISQVDIRIGFVTESKSDILYVIGTSMDDLWSPIFSIERLPSTSFSDLEFHNRIKGWMCQELNDDIVLEYYDFTKSVHFKHIIGQKITDVELLNIEGMDEPFGIKLLFDNDLILSLSNSDGNTIETKTFNKNENVRKFNHLGKVIYSKL